MLPDESTRRSSPLSHLSERVYDRKTTIKHSNVDCGLTPTRIVEANPNRVMLQIHNPDPDYVHVAWDGNVTTTGDIMLSPQGGTLTLTFQEDGEVVGYEVWGVATPASAVVTVTEVIVI